MRDVRKKAIIVSAGIFFLLFVAGVAFAIKQSDLLAVRAVEFVGVPAAYGERVQRDLEDFFLTHSLPFRILGAGHMLAWNSDPAEFIAAHPQFKLLRVEKDYARRTIRIIIDGREKFGVWCRAGESGVPFVDSDASSTVAHAGVGAHGDACYWFDRDGMLFAEAPQVQSELFNRIQDFTGRTLGLRDKILSERLFANLTSVFTLLESTQINTKTIVIRDLALEEVEVDSVSDPLIYLSLHISPEFAVSAIDAIKKSGDWKRVDYVDLRAENRAYYR